MRGYEIREYPEHIVAQTTVQGPYREAMGRGFRIVANYIFGGNTKTKSIAMTAPVVLRKADKGTEGVGISMTAPVLATLDGDAQVVSFGMPRSYTLETLPTPNDPRVKIVVIPAKKYAVMRFSGYRTNVRIANKQQELLALLARDGATLKGKAVYAGYNAPGTPPWMTRNEVMIEVA